MISHDRVLSHVYLIPVFVLILCVAGCGGAAQRKVPDSSTAAQPRLEADVQVGSPRGMHPSWDINNDGINDCEHDGSCDHTVDYSRPRETR